MLPKILLMTPAFSLEISASACLCNASICACNCAKVFAIMTPQCFGLSPAPGMYLSETSGRVARQLLSARVRQNRLRDAAFRFQCLSTHIVAGTICGMPQQMASTSPHGDASGLGHPCGMPQVHGHI